jgi:hypothetical protein
MNLPSNWDIVKDVDNTLPTPSAWEIELAVVSSSVVSGFSNNILILGTDLNRITTSKEYSMLNNVWARTDYLEYTELSSREITFVDGEISILYEFEARYNLNTPRLKFLQTAHICNYTRAYFITLALPTSVSDISRYVDFIQSFRCK